MKELLVGIDAGSTTIKVVVMENNEIIFTKYQRHFSNLENALKIVFDELKNYFENKSIKIKVTGSGGIGLAKWLNIEFVQEVIACTYAVKQYIPETDVVIELGGEDAKITYFGETIDQRMNGSCAGGTGAFIDQMAVLLNTDATGVNDLAKDYDKLYPIAARCGVFAKTDIQPLINEGVSRSNIAASIYQAVVNQTISGLAAGKPIVGNVAFLGGPLSFSDSLRQRFIETLQLGQDEVIVPKDSMMFVAIGTALCASEVDGVSFNDLYDKLANSNMQVLEETTYLDPLFKNHDEYEEFKKIHEKHRVLTEKIDYEGNAFLGIDAGSTTSKLVVISENRKLIYHDYRNNMGNPLKTIKEMLEKMYETISDKVSIVYTGSTGYGESLTKAAFKLDIGEIETICHYKAAAQFNPDVDFILDIGGQDMKCMRIKNGVVYDIMLNEACSSGCGSFIEGFARTLEVPLEKFVQEAISSKHPVELGSRCTVFMNSKVKQSQKEGASVADISAGLAYSVIKNALVKVIKVTDFDKIGDNIVVQGGTFYNDAVLRAFEKVVGKTVIRPDISGLMGAFGVALIALDNYNSELSTNFLSKDNLNNLSYKSKAIRCGLCENNCSMTMNTFNDGSKFIMGNKCEKGAGATVSSTILPNIYQYKYERVFNYESLSDEEAFRGEMAIPRVLNIYEHYPFWHTFFTDLGFKVSLSPRSNKAIYELGMDSITSDTICYPAKLVNGHIKALIKSGKKQIFYPCLPYENKARSAAQKNFNCPIVISYPEAIANNIEFEDVKYYSPFLAMDNVDSMTKALVEAFADLKISKNEIKQALKKAEVELANYKNDVASQGEEILKYMEDNNLKGVVLASRPYHIDPEINHGLEKIITELGMVVLSEDAICHLVEDDLKLSVLDQWSFHSRLYLAAKYCSQRNDLEFVQLTSFGCGIDAIVSEQASEILRAAGKNYSLIKIDEGSNTGAIKIRLRSIQAAMLEREKSGISLPKEIVDYSTPAFTKEMKKNHTLLIPQMSPIHFTFLEASLRQAGYNAVVLPSVDSNAIDYGVKYVNNDSCYPAIIVIGQILKALESGNYDLDNTSVVISQTGGGCRASNYITLLRKALVNAGYTNIPVISFNLVGLEENPGFKITLPMFTKIVMGVLYGDLLMRLSNRTRPYEINKGETDALVNSWTKKIIKSKMPVSIYKYQSIINSIIKDFEEIPINKDTNKQRIGVVGEILIKYHPTGNNELFATIENEGAEVIVPDLMDFVLYSAYNNVYNYENLGRSKKAATIANSIIKLVDFYRKPIMKRLNKSNWYTAPTTIYEKIDALKGIVSVGNQTGEGWFLTAELMELLKHGVNNIITVQPFGCLPNHIFAKSVLKPIRKHYPKANILAIDYDPGLSEVNQLNRIKLLLEMSKL